jgi:putative DNA primase/helicase
MSPSVHLAELPRMADYAMWGEAVGRRLGWEPGTFLSTYTDNRKEATLTDLLDSPLGNALLKIASLIPAVSQTPTKPYAKLTPIVGNKVAASANWPKNHEKFGNALRRLAPQLLLHGVTISFERRHEGRMIILKSERAPIASAGDARAKTESR